MGHLQYWNFPACSVISPVSHWTDCRLIVLNEEPCAVSTAASCSCSPSLPVRNTQLVHPSSLTGTIRRVMLVRTGEESSARLRQGLMF